MTTSLALGLGLYCCEAGASSSGGDDTGTSTEDTSSTSSAGTETDAGDAAATTEVEVGEPEYGTSTLDCSVAPRQPAAPAALSLLLLAAVRHRRKI